MTNPIKDERMDIYFERDSILVRQKWRYIWTIWTSGLSEWTHAEKQDFHNKADLLIWKIWGGTKFKIILSGNTELSRRYPKGLGIKFDIQWVLKNQHWTVYVRKVKEGDKTFRSSMRDDAKWIDLSSRDIHERERYNETYKKIRKMFTILHEFGHAIGNDNSIDGITHGDEYFPRSPHCRDFDSIMNIGNEIRSRHFDYLLKILKAKFPQTTFSISM